MSIVISTISQIFETRHAFEIRSGIRYDSFTTAVLVLVNDYIDSKGWRYRCPYCPIL